MRALLFAAVLFLPVCASASNWVQLGYAPGRTVSVDTETLRHVGPITKAWTLTSIDTPMPLGKLGFYQAAKFQYGVDCANYKMAILQSIYYADKAGTGGPLDTVSTPDSQLEWFEPAPDTQNELVFQFLCPKEAGT